MRFKVYGLRFIQKVLGNKFVIYGNHEQYFYKDYLAYQSDYLEKLMLAAKILTESGYVYGFAEELAERPSVVAE